MSRSRIEVRLAMRAGGISDRQHRRSGDLSQIARKLAVFVLGLAGAQGLGQSNTPVTVPSAPVIPTLPQGTLDPSSNQSQDTQRRTTTMNPQSPDGNDEYNPDSARRYTDAARGTLDRDNAARTNQRDTRDGNPSEPDRLTEFQQLVQNTTGQLLPIFGSSLFQRVPSTFAPIDNIPVPADYILGPDDQVRVQLFGQVNQQNTFFVDRTGSIQLPGIGPAHVAGLRFDQLQSMLKAQYSKLYRNFDLTVNLGQLRTIQIFVVGQARRPGSYTVSSLSTLLNALFASGGVLPQGSLRAIQVLRNGQAVTTFDMYDLLLRGDKTKDIKLEPGDVIFIPVAGPQVAVYGSVANPAIYEALPGTTVSDVLKLAGGGTSVAIVGRVRLDRVFEHTMRSVVDVNLTQGQNPVLANGDIVTVGEISDRFKNAVTLRGNVANPGRYVWHAGMKITDLIPNKEALITRDYFHRRNQLGQFVLDYNNSGQPSSQQAVPSTDPFALRARDTNAESAANASRSRSSSTTGAGGSSISTALTGNNGTFEPKNNVVITAPDINWSYAVIERQDSVYLTSTLIPFSLGKILLNGDKSEDLEVFPNDIVTVFSTADIRVPAYQQTRYVRLEGEFVAAGVYSVRPGETFRQLLARAGGFTPDAYLYGSSFTRESTRRVEKQRLNEYADSLEAQITAYTATNSARAISDRDAAASASGTADSQRVVSRLRQLEPEGRIVLPLKPDSRTVDTLPDLALEDGDRFVVPRVPSVVNVEGQVYSANAFVFERGHHTKDYIRLAGGPDRQADRKRAFVLRADGSVYSEQYGNVARATIFPGDTIVIPPQLSRRAILRDLIDISSIIGQFGIGVAAINVLR